MKSFRRNPYHSSQRGRTVSVRFVPAEILIRLRFAAEMSLAKALVSINEKREAHMKNISVSRAF